MMKRKMTRRNFLKVAAAVSAAGVMSACGGDGMPLLPVKMEILEIQAMLVIPETAAKPRIMVLAGIVVKRKKSLRPTGSIEKQTIWFRMERLKSRAIMERWSLMW